MHAIHTTPGFVIDSRPYSEAGKILSIFTRDLGLISAVAQGIRLEKSKLRYHVQNYSFATYSLVRGKEFWRLTSAAEGDLTEPSSVALLESDRKTVISQKPSNGMLIASIALLLRRLLQGEEAHPELFELVQTCSSFLHSNPNISEEQLKSLESLTVLRILHSLGYVGKEPQFVDYLASANFNPEILRRATGDRTLINKHINNALKESHL